MTDQSYLATAREQARRLGFGVDDDVLRDVVETARGLESAAGELGDAGTGHTVEAVEAQGEYNELLATYDSPRREAEGGTLDGLTVAVKDNVAVEGLAMTCGSSKLRVDPGTDAALVERLLDEGAAVVGKTNQDAFAFGPSGEFSDFDAVANPVDTERVPGGSSSGSGAAVAAGTVDVALGSDTGGSVRIPAACCGVVGAKPTHGLIPRHGFVGFAPSLDTVGPLARSVEDATAALAAMAGPDRRDPTASERGLEPVDDDIAGDGPVTVGLPAPFVDRSDDAVADAVRAAVDEAANVRTAPVTLDMGAVEQAYFLVGATEFVWYLDQTATVRGQGTDYTGAIHDALAAVKDSDLGSHVARRLLPAALLDDRTEGRAYLAARRETLRFVERVDDALHSVDALVMPTIRTLPPRYGRMDTTADMLTLLGNTAPFNLARTPAVSVPVGSVDGLPVNAQVVTPRFEDLRALAVADRLSSRG
jgi:aspartyl-tRNA(Asn)/glutamyl-tRNA(Gln) amidotransferase subunit A